MMIAAVPVFGMMVACQPAATLKAPVAEVADRVAGFSYRVGSDGYPDAATASALLERILPLAPAGW